MKTNNPIRIVPVESSIMNTRLDRTSWAVIVITLVLFVTAVFVKGLGHDLLLEAGVFLVSVKLILMSYKNSAAAERLSRRLDALHGALARIEAHLGAHPEHDQAKPAVTPHMPPEAEGLPPELGTDARR
jgi:hypothetical protein